MGRTLIVAEKPSQAREYAVALGVRAKRDGYFENEEYVITWCYGHLLELERPEAYMDLKKVGRRWSLSRLPVLPGLRAFRRVVKPNSEKQYEIVQHWLKSAEIKEIICGTDADREGQLLFQEVWDASQCNKPLSRLWISSLTKAAILEGMQQLRSAESVAGLAAAGNGRAYADWDFGMNLTEGFTALFGSFDSIRKKPNVISIGRVQTPTLALIVEREWEIESFVVQPFYEVRGEFSVSAGNYMGKWFDPDEDTKRITDPRMAEKLVEKTQGKSGQITRLEQRDVQEPAPFLFDLTSLTVTASKKFGFSAEKVLQLAQSLYEKKAITYPRTDCVYLSKDILPKLKDHLGAVSQGPYKQLADEAGHLGVPKGKRVINTISAHHAIIPTTEKISLERLNREEQKLYDLVVRRFLAVWFPSALYHQTEVITSVEGEQFRTKGKVLKHLGWKKVYRSDDSEAEDTRSVKKTGKDHSEEENTVLPPLVRGESAIAERVYSEEKTTKPPKRYTQGDLLKAMEGAGKQIDDELIRQQLKGKGLGTVATRPAIIENLVDRGYILQERKSLKPTEKGIELIRLIKERLPQAQLLISAEMTGQMEFNLSKVEKGELGIEEYMLEVEKAIRRIITELNNYQQKHGKTPLALAPSPDSKPTKSKGESKGQPYKKEAKKKHVQNHSQTLGKCPKCGGEVIEGQKGFGCSNWREGCSFVLWKTPICGKVLTPAQVRSLLTKGKTAIIRGFKSKTGKSFAARLILEDPAKAKLRFEVETS